MPGLFFLDFVSLKALLVATWLKPLLKDIRTDLSSCSHIVSCKTWTSDWAFFLGTFLSQRPWGLARVFLPWGQGSACIPAFHCLEAQVVGWNKCKGQFLCESIWLFLPSSSYPSSFSLPPLPHWCRILGITLSFGSRMLVKTMPFVEFSRSEHMLGGAFL